MSPPAWRSLVLTCLSVLASACDGGAGLVPHREPPAGLPIATAMADCAPWDGPAVSIYLTPAPFDSFEPPLPHLRLSLYRPAVALAYTTISWPADQEPGVAVHCPAQGECRSAVSARIRLRRVVPDSLLEGDFDLRFPDHSTLGGGFRAAWRRLLVMCG